MIRTTASINEYPAVFYGIATTSGDSYVLVASPSVPQGKIKNLFYGQHWSAYPIMYPGDYITIDGLTVDSVTP